MSHSTYHSSHYQLTSSKFLSEHESERLEALLRRVLDTEKGTTMWKYALAIALLHRVGARVSELLNCDAKNYIKDYRAIFIRGLKGSMDRQIPLPDWLAKALETHLKEITTEKIFDFGYHILARAWHFLRPVKKPLHALRHTCAIKAYIKTKDILLVKRLLGHRSINNTMIYVDYVVSMKEMRRILY